MNSFRIHFADGDVIVVTAVNPAEARRSAIRRRLPDQTAIITKVKIDRCQSHPSQGDQA